MLVLIMSIPTLLQLSCTSNFLNFQCTGAWFMDWHLLHAQTTIRTAAFEIVGLTCLTKYNVRLTPGCPLRWWMARMRVDSCSSMEAAHTGSVSFWSTSNHRWGTLVSWSARFTWDLMSSTSTVSAKPSSD